MIKLYTGRQKQMVLEWEWEGIPFYSYFQDDAPINVLLDIKDSNANKRTIQVEWIAVKFQGKNVDENLEIIQSTIIHGTLKGQPVMMIKLDGCYLLKHIENDEYEYVNVIKYI